MLDPLKKQTSEMSRRGKTNLKEEKQNGGLHQRFRDEKTRKGIKEIRDTFSDL